MASGYSRSFEALEARHVLSSNVTVSLVGSNLTITGDNAQNVVYLVPDNGHITILSADATNLVVHGKTGFDVVGSAEVKVTASVQNVTIRMNGGDDLLELLGNYDFQQSPSLVTPLAISGKLSIDMGNGQNNLLIDGADVGGATTILGGAGSNRFTITGSTFTGSFSATVGNGGNQIDLGDQSGPSHGPNVFNGQFTYNTGKGNDTFTDYGGAQFNGTVQVNLGAGNDLADLGDSQFDGNTLFDGGSGNDTILVQGATGPTFSPQMRHVIRNFETNQL